MTRQYRRAFWAVVVEQPLTNVQIWGLTDEEMPKDSPKDYLAYEEEEVIDQPHSQATGPGDEIDR